MYFLLLLLFFIPASLCNLDYQNIPFNYESAINHLARHQQTNLIELLDQSSVFSITPHKLSSYVSSLISNNQTTQCERDLEVIIEALMKRETWAMKVFDAWGKPIPSGILKGNIYLVGDYDECLQPMYVIGNKTFVAQPFDTQYCTLLPTPGTMSFYFGLCVPSSCNREGVVSFIHSVFQTLNVTTNDLRCSNDPRNGQKGLTTGAIITITILSLLACLVFVGTIADLILIFKHNTVSDMPSHVNGQDHIEDVVKTERTSLNFPVSSRDSMQTLIDHNPRMAFLAEFSALKNLRRIFTIEKKNNSENYAFLNGIRVLSLFWVIIGHSLISGLFYPSNPIDVITWTRNVLFQFIYNAEFSVDTFFVLSGLLTTILFVRQVEKEKKLSPRLMFLYYIHRYIRLTPTFLLIVAISINLTPYFGSGPLYPTQQGFETSQCRSKYWWTSIVYIGNIFKSDYSCLRVSWYLHNDMQFHWIAPLTLIPFVLGRKPLAFVVSTVLVLVGIGSIAGLLIYYPDLQASDSLAGAPSATNGRTFYNTIYVAPWCRISAYFIGVLTGFFVVNTDRSHRLNKYVFIFGNIVSILFVLICFFGMYPDTILAPGIDRTSFIFYQSVSRALWSIAIGWLLFLCMINRAQLINRVLSWSIWIPLARLNYATYLTHLSLIQAMIANQRLPFYFQPHLVINNFVVHIFFGYLIAIFVVIFIETPFFLIEKKLFKR